MIKREKLWIAAVYVLLLVFAAIVPIWSYSIAWGDRPSEIVGLALAATLSRLLFMRPPQD